MIRKSRSQKNDLCTVTIRITCNRISSYISTSLKLRLDQWDDQKREPKRTLPNYRAAKAMLDKHLQDINAIFLAAEMKGKRLQAKEVKELVLNENREFLITYIRKWIQKRLDRKDITQSTWLKYNGIIDKLEEVFGNSITIDQFDFDLLDRFEQALIDKYKNSTNTVASNFSFLRAVANKLIEDDKMKLNDYPFRKYKLKFKEVKRKYLTPEQIKEIENIILPPNSKLELSRDIFIFCTQTGFRIGDALLLTSEHFNGERFVFLSQKNKNQINLPCTDKAKSIINRVSKQNANSKFIFNFLSEEDLNIDKKALDRQKSATALINKNLGIISERLGFDFKFSTHYARHSLATNALTNGLSLEQIKAILHHRNIKTTEIYAKAVDQMKEEAMKMIG